jgi:uncharacterized protein GlcG (DUF336 family)
MKMTYPLAWSLGSIAEAEALALGVPMVIAVVDGAGGLLFFGRMEGALPVSTEIAIGKAYTAAGLRMATHEVGKLAQPGEVLYGIQHTPPGKIVLFGGGLPLRLKGQVVGAIGISGGTVEEDIQVAKPVVNALEQMECLSERIRGLVSSRLLKTTSMRGLENKIAVELERMNCPPPTGGVSVLTGAVILAASEDQ